MSDKYESFLMHYGVKGQKWGVRRFQNDDGSLTAEGQQRYGHLKDRGDKGAIKKWTLGSEGGAYAFAKWRERRHAKNIDKVKNKYTEKIQKTNDKIADSKKNAEEYYKGDKEWQKASEEGLKEHRERLEVKRDKKLEKYQSKLEAQKAADRNLDAYRKHSSAAKLIMQNAGVLGIMGHQYRHSRSRGSGIASSILEAAGPIGIPIRMIRDKKAYGKYIVFSEPSENEYYADKTD